MGSFGWLYQTQHLFCSARGQTSFFFSHRNLCLWGFFPSEVMFICWTTSLEDLAVTIPSHLNSLQRTAVLMRTLRYLWLLEKFGITKFFGLGTAKVSVKCHNFDLTGLRSGTLDLWSLFHVAAALALCKRHFPCLNSCQQLPFLLVFASSLCLLYLPCGWAREHVWLEQLQSWVLEGEGSGLKRQSPPKAGLLPGHCVRGSVHPSAGLAELGVTKQSLCLCVWPPSLPGWCCTPRVGPWWSVLTVLHHLSV